MPSTLNATPAPFPPTVSSVKRATNLTLSAYVLDEAKRLKLNVSQICDAHLKEYVKEELSRRWREEHADFVTAYNLTVAQECLPLDEWRTF
jgi:antitoxin CcdA